MSSEEMAGHTSQVYVNYDYDFFITCSCGFEKELPAEPSITQIIDVWREHLRSLGNG